LGSLLSQPQVAGDYDALVAVLRDRPLPRFGWPKSETKAEKGKNEGAQTSVIGELKPGESVETASLRGLKDVYVVVETLSTDAKRITTEQQIKTDTELQLRRYGINVPRSLSQEGCVLYLDVSVMRDECSGVNAYYYHIELELQQEVLLKRDKAYSIPLTPTWSRGSSGLAGEGVAISSLKTGIAKLVDKFINDYLAAQQR